MKVTDYCARAAPFDSYLTGRNLVGAEIGVDVGAHAQAMLQHADVSMLHLVDPWPNPYCRGYCEGRLSVLGYRMRFKMNRATSVEAARQLAGAQLDFVYIDQEHDGASVAADLAAWWTLLKPGGVLGYRNYTTTPNALKAAVDVFMAAHKSGLAAHVETGEIVIVKTC
jgi:Methyltransferase domain